MDAAGSSETPVTTKRYSFISSNTGLSEPEPVDQPNLIHLALTETFAEASTRFLMQGTCTILPDTGMEKCWLLSLGGLHPAAAGAGSQDTSDTSGQPNERVE
jgi:hypothetical protein